MATQQRLVQESTATFAPSRAPSPSQREAIEAEPRALLVLAGPGAGKTFCLIERIAFLVQHHGVDPARICAFTFTNKAAEEIEHRLEERLGSAAAERIARGTIHAFCADLLREFGGEVGLPKGFGIADEDYQLGVLRKIDGGPKRWHPRILTRFAAHRFRGEPLLHNDSVLFMRYEELLGRRGLVDFDSLVIRAAELLEQGTSSAAIRARYDVILVDEFQDLNPVQYRVVKALARDHSHVFAVGDSEQSIYSWAGADPRVFASFLTDFSLVKPVQLEENRRCPRTVFDLAWRLVEQNPSLFDDRAAPVADRETPFPVVARSFADDDAECSWLVADLQRDIAASRFDLAEVAVLYRKHEIGERLETALLNAGMPCRLASGRALADDPVIAYVLAAIRVIAQPGDDVPHDAFFAATLSQDIIDEARASAGRSHHSLKRTLRRMLGRLAKGDERAKEINRALYLLGNLRALGERHTSTASLVQELLSQKVGKRRSVLDENHEDLTDPAANREVVALADRLRVARDRGAEIHVPLLGGSGLAIRAMLATAGFAKAVVGQAPDDERTMTIAEDDVPSLGIALGVFKALQYLECADVASAFSDFTAVDLETTDRDVATSEICEIAAVRVRGGQIVDEFSSLVKPRGRISEGAARTHGISQADVAAAPPFEDIWPKFRRFCGDDVAVAHNGYAFDFPILARLAGKRFDLTVYDTLPLARGLYPTSRRLEDLARSFHVDPGQSHRALDDCRTLARVFVAMEEVRLSKARKTSLVNLLGHLGVALALADRASLPAEARLFVNFCRVFSLGRYSGALEAYEQASAGREDVPSVDELVEALGGFKLRDRIRAEKSPEDRYPLAMARLRRIIDELPAAPLLEQLALFLERAALSRQDGTVPEQGRINLLTLHSTKGLEFSRVYIVGAEDAQLPGIAPNGEVKPAELEEARRLLYVGMTRTKDRLVLTTCESRNGQLTGGHRFLDEMGLAPASE